MLAGSILYTTSITGLLKNVYALATAGTHWHGGGWVLLHCKCVHSGWDKLVGVAIKVWYKKYACGLVKQPAVLHTSSKPRQCLGTILYFLCICEVSGLHAMFQFRVIHCHHIFSIIAIIVNCIVKLRSLRGGGGGGMHHWCGIRWGTLFKHLRHLLLIYTPLSASPPFSTTPLRGLMGSLFLQPSSSGCPEIKYVLYQVAM